MKKAYFTSGDPRIIGEAFNRRQGITHITSGVIGAGDPPQRPAEVEQSNDFVFAVEIGYDPAHISYETLLAIFFEFADPTDSGGQFKHRGKAYRPIIHTSARTQEDQANAMVRNLSEQRLYEAPIVVELQPLKTFYPLSVGPNLSELSKSEYDHMFNSPARKRMREAFKPFKHKRLHKQLSRLSYLVTQEAMTESPYQNPYHDNKDEGLYVDIASGEPIFTTNEQYDSGCGWPSFTHPLERLETHLDESMGMRRVEVRSRRGDSHLGHVFDDGPSEAGGLRYCINSASMRFIPKDRLKKEGYAEYLKYFK